MRAEPIVSQVCLSASSVVLIRFMSNHISSCEIRGPAEYYVVLFDPYFTG